ncbi:MAG: hypothetical protein ACLPVY_01430 [Acidimicrobiia bacterium]
MVRFSDMLSGNGDPEQTRPVTTAADPAPADEPLEPDSEAEPETADADLASASQSPEDVLDRLTQYATSARGSDPASEPQPAEEDPTSQPGEDPDELTPVGDDLLPHAKGETRKRRRK